jgi:hypothetical protein
MRQSCAAAAPVPFTLCAMSQASDPAVGGYRMAAVSDAACNWDRVARVMNHHASGVPMLAQVCGVQGSDFIPLTRRHQYLFCF